MESSGVWGKLGDILPLGGLTTVDDTPPALTESGKLVCIPPWLAAPLLSAAASGAGLAGAVWRWQPKPRLSKALRNNHHFLMRNDLAATAADAKEILAGGPVCFDKTKGVGTCGEAALVQERYQLALGIK